MKGAVWLSLSRLLTNSLGLVSTFVLARMLTPSDFGIVAIATAILAIATSITDLSLSSALVQRSDLVDDHFHSVWTMTVLRSLIVFSVILAAAFPLAHIYREPRLVPVLIATGFVSGLPGIASPRMAVLTRSLVFWQEFAVQTVSRLVVFAGAVGGALLLKNYWALIVGNLFGAVSAVVLSYIIAPYLPRVSFKKFRELFSFSFWLSMGDTVNTLNWKCDQLVLGYLVGKAPLGVYTVADNISVMPTRESTVPLTKTLFPAFSRIANDPVRLRQAYTRAQTLVFAIAMPMGCGFSLVADPIVHLFLGQKWLPAIPIIQILAANFALQTLSTSLQPLAMAKGETKVLFGRDVRTFVIRIPFIIIGFLVNGLMGVVVARAISSSIGTVWNMALVRDLSGISVRRQFADNGRTLLATAAMVGVALFAQLLLARAGIHLPPIGAIVMLVGVGGVTYVGARLGLWLIQGRPLGPESEVLGVVSRFIPKAAVLALRPGR